jgi:predicted TPR repeat methyltransferase
LHEFEAAARHFGRADELAPGDPGTLLGLGAMLLQIGQSEAALAALHRAVERAPEEPQIRFELARALALTGAGAEARETLDQARTLGLQADALGYLEHLIEGREGGAATVANLRRLYDQAAPHYESHVVVGLDNRTWRLLLELLDGQAGSAGRWMAGLELGCGPGQAGAELRRRAHHLTGVDLSPAMIEQARRRGVYDRLIAADLMAFLGNAEEEESFDLMFASDVLPHIGDFVALLSMAANRLRPGGLFLFSTEHSETEDRVPLPEFRFRHSLAYVENAATAAGLAMPAHEIRQIRIERGAPVMGGLYLLRRPS